MVIDHSAKQTISEVPINLSRTHVEILKIVDTEGWSKYGKTEVFNINVWPIVRADMFINLLEGREKKQYFEKHGIYHKFKKELGNRYWFSKLRNIFSRKYKYLFFSVSSERKNIDGKLFHRLMDPIIDYFGAQNCLMIERKLSSGVWEKAYTQNIFSEFMLELIKVPIHLFLTFYCKLIRSIASKSIVSQKKIVGFLSSYYFYKFWFLINPPKYIFITVSYGRYSLVKAAKESGAVVIELQHGIVNYPHFGYHGNHELESIYQPDYLFVFGEWDKYEIDKSRLISHTKPIVVGSFYVEYVKRKIAEKFQERDDDQSAINVVVTVQEVEQEEILKLISDAALIDRSINYILIPRKSETDYKLPDNIANIQINNNLEVDSYHRIALSDVHATVYSTCAYEAISFGVPTVFLNIRGLSEQYYQDMISSTEFFEIANTPLQLVDSVKKLFNKKVYEELKNNKKYVIPGDYANRLTNALEFLCKDD